MTRLLGIGIGLLLAASVSAQDQQRPPKAEPITVEGLRALLMRGPNDPSPQTVDPQMARAIVDFLDADALRPSKQPMIVNRMNVHTLLFSEKPNKPLRGQKPPVIIINDGTASTLFVGEDLDLQRFAAAQALVVKEIGTLTPPPKPNENLRGQKPKVTGIESLDELVKLNVLSTSGLVIKAGPNDPDRSFFGTVRVIGPNDADALDLRLRGLSDVFTRPIKLSPNEVKRAEAVGK